MIIDLTHPLSSGIPAWPGDPRFTRANHASIDREGFALGRIELGEHTGTHIGSGRHFQAEGRSVDELPPELLMLPAVVVDVREDVSRNHDFQVAKGLFSEWEARRGQIPPSSAVLLCTGWSQRWTEERAYLNIDDRGNAHTPGYSLEAARWLAMERGVVALGIDAPGIDAGVDSDYSVNRFWLQGNRYHIENLAHLEEVPATGAKLFVGALPIIGGTGAPARVLAVF